MSAAIRGLCDQQLTFSYKWPYYIPSKVFSTSVLCKEKN